MVGRFVVVVVVVVVVLLVGRLVVVVGLGGGRDVIGARVEVAVLASLLAVSKRRICHLVFDVLIFLVRLLLLFVYSMK